MGVHCYSNSPTVLTGIVDSKDNLAQLESLFARALVWAFSNAGARLGGAPAPMPWLPSDLRAAQVRPKRLYVESPWLQLTGECQRC
jgi:hypothetical protein